MSYADVNGVRLWYEFHGTGRPLVLLHGGYGSVEMFAPILPALTARRQVIAVDLQGHGRTADVDRPLRYESMADDIGALLRHLDLPEADVLGYSLGGGVALRTAIQHPDRVRRLVLVSTAFRRGGWYPEVLAAMAAQDERVGEQMRGTPPHELYEKVAPRPQDWPRLWPRPASCCAATTTGPPRWPPSPCRCCWSSPTPTRSRSATWRSSTGCSAAGTGMPAGTAATGRRPGWPCCPA